MRTRFALLAVVAFAVPLFAAPIPKGKEAPKDEKLIEGTWQLDAFEGGPAGGGGPPPDIKSIRFTFKEGKVTMKGGPAGVDMSREGDYKLDPTAKPKQLDMTLDGRTAPGIYELDGDTLKWCMSEGSMAARPEELKGGGKVILVTFKRVKEDADDKKDDPKKETPKAEPTKPGK